MMRTAISISLSKTERETLRRWARDCDSRLGQRARIVLLAADGQPNNEIAVALGTDPQTVGRWRSRFASERLAGIAKDAPRTGRKRRARQRVEGEVLRLTARAGSRRKPWSTRALAQRLGVNHMLVYRVWRDHHIASGGGTP